MLACTVERRVERIGLVQLRAGASMIDLQRVNPGPEDSEFSGPTKNMDHFAIRIEPFDPKSLRSHLANHGIDPGEVVQRYGAEGDGPSVYISDPDGNTIELKGPAS
ncbi:MAG: hypothetical protein ACFB13_20895 [Kiloniellaceae bacterium]